MKIQRTHLLKRLDTLYLSYNTSFGNWKNSDHYVNLRVRDAAGPHQRKSVHHVPVSGKQRVEIVAARLRSVPQIFHPAILSVNNTCYPGDRLQLFQPFRI